MTLAAWLLQIRPPRCNVVAYDYAASVLERYATQRGRMWRQWRCG